MQVNDVACLDSKLVQEIFILMEAGISTGGIILHSMTHHKCMLVFLGL